MTFIHATFIAHIGKDNCENPTKSTDKPFGRPQNPVTGISEATGPCLGKPWDGTDKLLRFIAAPWRTTDIHPPTTEISLSALWAGTAIRSVVFGYFGKPTGNPKSSTVGMHDSPKWRCRSLDRPSRSPQIPIGKLTILWFSDDTPRPTVNVCLSNEI